MNNHNNRNWNICTAQNLVHRDYSNHVDINLGHKHLPFHRNIKSIKLCFLSEQTKLPPLKLKCSSLNHEGHQAGTTLSVKKLHQNKVLQVRLKSQAQYWRSFNSPGHKGFFSHSQLSAQTIIKIWSSEYNFCHVTICLLHHSGESLQNGQLELQRRNWYFALETHKDTAVSVWACQAGF